MDVSMTFIDFDVSEGGKLKVILAGRLDLESIGGFWGKAFAKLSEIKPKLLEIDANKVDYCDGAGIGFLLELKRRQQSRTGDVQIDGLSEELGQLMVLFDLGEVFIILGGSDCGKSTLLKQMISLRRPVKGKVLIGGVDIIAAEGGALRGILGRIGVMYQNGALFGSVNLLENIFLFACKLFCFVSRSSRLLAASGL